MKFVRFWPQRAERAGVIEAEGGLRDPSGLCGDLAVPVVADLERFAAARAIKLANAASAIKCQTFGGRLGAPDRTALQAFLEERT
jgi:hypothetical protein